MTDENNKLHDQVQKKEAAWARKYDELWEFNNQCKAQAEDFKEKNKALRAKLAPSKAEVKDELPITSKEPEKPMASATIELKETPAGGPNYRVQNDRLKEKAEEVARAKLREERQATMMKPREEAEAEEGGGVHQIVDHKAQA